MSWGLLISLAVVTVASRMLPMTLLPRPSGRVAAWLEVLPAPLFASLAALALVGADGPMAPLFGALLGAVPGIARRSLGLTLAGGVVGHLLVGLLMA